MPKAFGDYAGYMAGKLSDRVQDFMTVNELRPKANEAAARTNIGPSRNAITSLRHAASKRDRRLVARPLRQPRASPASASNARSRGTAISSALRALSL